MSIESITSIIAGYLETACPLDVSNYVYASMMENFGGLLCSLDTDKIIYECPHCLLCCETYLSELACCIFRHGSINGVYLSPHECKEQCDRFAAMVGVQGCCKPYQIICDKKIYIVKICGYI